MERFTSMSMTDVSTGLKGNQFVGRVGSSSGNGCPVSNTPPCHLDQSSMPLTSCTPMRPGLLQDKQLPSGVPNGKGNVETRRARWPSRGQSHGRIVVARSVPEILSAGEPKRKATRIFAASRRQEHTPKPAPR